MACVNLSVSVTKWSSKVWACGSRLGDPVMVHHSDRFDDRNVVSHHGCHHFSGSQRMGRSALCGFRVEVLEPMPPGVVGHVDVVDVLRQGLHGVRLPQPLLEMRLTPWGRNLQTASGSKSEVKSFERNAPNFLWIFVLRSCDGIPTCPQIIIDNLVESCHLERCCHCSGGNTRRSRRRG